MDHKSDLLVDFFRSIQRQRVWGVIAGAGSGSHVSLKLGSKIPFIKPLKNPTLTDDERGFDGEFWIYVEGANWRLESISGEPPNATLLCEAESPDTYSKLSQIRGLQIVDTIVHSPDWSVDLAFSSGLHFKIICDSTFGDDNYSVGGVERAPITVGARGELLSK